jgi:hypothetical protein
LPPFFRDRELTPLFRRNDVSFTSSSKNYRYIGDEIRDLPHHLYLLKFYILDIGDWIENMEEMFL